jgi:hypothetical protein
MSGDVADELTQSTGVIGWDEDCLIVTDGAVLPHRCVDCGGVATCETEDVVERVPAWLSLLPWLAKVFVRKSATVTYFRCDACESRAERRERLLKLTLAPGILGIVVGAALVAWPGSRAHQLGNLLVGVGFVGVVLALAAMHRFRPKLHAKRIDRSRVWLRDLPRSLAE